MAKEQENDFELAHRALDILAPVLGDWFSQEDEDREAAAWEATNGEPLIRSWEDEESFNARAKKFRWNIPEFVCAPDIAKAEIERLMQIEPKSERLIRQIHELEVSLGRDKTDFMVAKKKDKDIIAAAKKRYAEIQMYEIWKERAAIVAEERDTFVLQMLVQHDKNETVREVAEKRLAVVSVT
jgi:hypothetical protein